MARKRKPGRPKGSKTKRGIGVKKRLAFKNLTHLPRTRRGRPEKKSHFILDMYDIKDKCLKTLITTFPVSKKQAELEARGFIGHHHGGKVVRSVTLAGPYNFKPNKKTERI